jgi:hypothetical protein
MLRRLRTEVAGAPVVVAVAQDLELRVHALLRLAAHGGAHLERFGAHRFDGALGEAFAQHELRALGGAGLGGVDVGARVAALAHDALGERGARLDRQLGDGVLRALAAWTAARGDFSCSDLVGAEPADGAAHRFRQAGEPGQLVSCEEVGAAAHPRAL